MAVWPWSSSHATCAPLGQLLFAQTVAAVAATPAALPAAGAVLKNAHMSLVFNASGALLSMSRKKTPQTPMRCPHVRLHLFV